VVHVNLQEQMLKFTDPVIQIFFQSVTRPSTLPDLSCVCFVCVCWKEEDKTRDPFQASHNSVMERAESCCKMVMRITNIRKPHTHTFQDFSQVFVFNGKEAGRLCEQLAGVGGVNLLLPFYIY